MRNIKTIVVALALAAMSVLAMMAPASASSGSSPTSGSAAMVPNLQPPPGPPPTSGNGMDPNPGGYRNCEAGNGPLWTPYYADRFHSCFLVHSGFDVVIKKNGVSVKVGNWTLLWIVTGTGSNGSQTMRYVVNSKLYSVTGVPPNPRWEWDAGLACINYYGSTCSNSNPGGEIDTVAWWSASHSFVFTFNTSSSPGYTPSGTYHGQKLYNGSDKLNYHAMSQWQNLPGQAKSWSNPEYFRGDRGTYFNGKNAGSLFYQVTPTWNISLSSNAGPVAQNLQKAETAPGTGTDPLYLGPGKVKIPGFKSTGQPLNRLYRGYAPQVNGQNQVDANRSKSTAQCLLYFPLYLLRRQSCDEYPMASTFQGSTNADGNPWWYTVKAVSVSANSSASGFWNGFLQQNRIVSGDPFWVAVVP